MADCVCDMVSRRQLNFAMHPLPGRVIQLIDGQLGNISSLHLHAEGPDRLREYPPINMQGEFVPWIGLRHGMMALPDLTIAGKIDHDPGGKCNAVLAHCDDGPLITSINVQSMRGGVSTAGKGKGKGKPKGLNGTSKKALVLHQLAQKCVHATGIQE